MDELFYAMAIIPEAQTLDVEKWLKDRFITYSMTKVVAKAVPYYSSQCPERAVGYLMLMAKSEYDEMIDRFNVKTWKGDK